MVCAKAGIAAESSFARFTNRAPFYSLTTLISAFTTFDSWFFLFFVSGLLQSVWMLSTFWRQEAKAGSSIVDTS